LGPIHFVEENQGYAILGVVSAAVLEETLLNMQADDDYKAVTKKKNVQKPVELADIANWTKFWELFMTYLSRTKGTSNMPLSYLIQEHGKVTQEEITAVDYDTTDDWLIATTVHARAHFILDNRMLYDELKPLVVDGPGWEFVRWFDKAKDEYNTVLALQGQAEEGLSAKLALKAKAYASITSATFHGQYRSFTFVNYVTLAIIFLLGLDFFYCRDFFSCRFSIHI
jgi:hypothetical protein